MRNMSLSESGKMTAWIYSERCWGNVILLKSPDIVNKIFITVTITTFERPFLLDTLSWIINNKNIYRYLKN